MKKFQWMAAAAMALGLVAAPAASEARTLRFAYGHPPGSILDYSAKVFAKTVAATPEAGLTVRNFPLSLLNLVETSEGLATGLADIGALMTPLYPKEYPHTNLAIEMSMLLLLEQGAPDEMQGVLYGAAITDFLLNDCPECLREFGARNNVFTAAAGSTAYTMNCTKPYLKLEDVKNARMRISGSYWARWSTAVNATPMTISGNEMLEALSQGVVDCVLLSVADVYNFGMGDLVTHITEGAPGGIYISSSAQMNREVWRSLNPLQRETIMRAAGAGAAATSLRYETMLREIRAKSQAGTVKAKFHQPAPSLGDATRKFVDGDVKSVVKHYATTYGVTRGDQIVEAVKARVAEWRGHLKGVSTEEQLAKLYWDKIYAEVDLKTYGQ